MCKHSLRLQAVAGACLPLGNYSYSIHMSPISQCSESTALMCISGDISTGLQSARVSSPFTFGARVRYDQHPNPSPLPHLYPKLQCLEDGNCDPMSHVRGRRCLSILAVLGTRFLAQEGRCCDEAEPNCEGCYSSQNAILAILRVSIVSHLRMPLLIEHCNDSLVCLCSVGRAHNSRP